MLIDDIRTLTNVVIVDPIQANLVSWVALSCEVVVTLAAQMKGGLYHDYYSMDVFFFLAIEVFQCLHWHVENFFHRCANMTWIAKGTEGLPLSMLFSFHKHRV